MKRRRYKITKNIKKAFSILDSFNNLILYIVKSIIWIIIMADKGIKNNRYIKHTGYTYFSLMNKIDNLSPRDFEMFCCELYKGLGYKAVLTAATNDYGRDIILTKDGKTIFVECKHYSKTNTIGREICMKLLGSVATFGADAGIIITTGCFNKNAYEIAGMVDNLELVDYTAIVDRLFNLNPIKISQIIDKIA